MAIPAPLCLSLDDAWTFVYFDQILRIYLHLDKNVGDFFHHTLLI